MSKLSNLKYKIMGKLDKNYESKLSIQKSNLSKRIKID